ncbi:MAG: hypothetical protein FJ279_03255 [Planctomycetes bacterium]|nr:hypothetical protein [Planctomycetota bacterium]
MTSRNADPILIVRAKGPATTGGRIALQDLLQLGRHIQAAVERVARVLVGQADSRKRGRKPREIESSCPLEVVALNRGSFEVALDLPREHFENMHLGVEAVEKLLEGLECIDRDGETLPPGYDTGVLHSLKDMGLILGKGIDEIEVESRTQRLRRRFSFNPRVHGRITSRIRCPMAASRTLEGQLLMADFRHDGERCRIHPPTGEPVVCQFDESLEETVYEYLRSFVRVTGETREDPATGRIVSITIRDIEPVSMEGAGFETISAEEFWQEKSLTQLVAEQGVPPVQRLEDVWGKGAELWTDEEDFEAFLAATKGVQGRRA